MGIIISGFSNSIDDDNFSPNIWEIIIFVGLILSIMFAFYEGGIA